MEDLKRILERLDDTFEHLSALSNALRLSKLVDDGLVGVDALIEFVLEFLLRHPHEEVADLLGHGVTHVTQHDLEVCIDTSSDLLNENIRRGGCLTSLLLWLLSVWVVRVELLLLLVVLILCSWHDGGAILFVLKVVGEEVVLLSIDNSFDNFTSVVAFFSNDVADDFHHDWAHSWESHEDTVDDCASEELKLSVDVLDELKSWLSQLLELWLDQVVKHID